MTDMSEAGSFFVQGFEGFGLLLIMWTGMMLLCGMIHTGTGNRKVFSGILS